MGSGSYCWAREGKTGKVDANCRDNSVSPAAGSGNRASIMNWRRATKAFLPGSEWSPAVLAGAVCVGDWHGEWAFFIGNSVVWTVSLWGKPQIPELGRAKNTAEKAISEREKCKQLTECYGLNRNVRVLKWVSEKTESCNLKWWISHCQLSQNVRGACVSREEAWLHSWGTGALGLSTQGWGPMHLTGFNFTAQHFQPHSWTCFFGLKDHREQVTEDPRDFHSRGTVCVIVWDLTIWCDVQQRGRGFPGISNESILSLSKNFDQRGPSSLGSCTRHPGQQRWCLW